MQPKILIAEDDATQRRVIESLLHQKITYKALLANDGKEAVDAILAGESCPDILLLDLKMPRMDGMEVLETIRPIYPNLPIIVLTASNDTATAVAAMKAGANDFITKPADADRLAVSVHNALRISKLQSEVQRLERNQSGLIGFSDLIGSSPAFSDAVSLARRASTSKVPVLLDGESGVGKEVFARAIHGSSDRAGQPFIAVNCGAIPENLAESILFGHEKGAFTGATQASLGKFREASGGTLFLDEIGELQPELQVKLLRAVQEGEIDPVGGKKPIPVDIRLISATNRDLEQQVAEGSFREDLYYRVSVFPITLPSLHERREDIIPLCNHFIARCAALENKYIEHLTDKAADLLVNHDWPGNVRELENTIFRAVLLCDDGRLDIEHFPRLSTGNRQQTAVSSIENSGSGTVISLFDHQRHCRTLSDIEKEMIETALAHYNGNMTEVARRLGIGRSTLYRKIQEYNLNTQADEN